MTHCWAQIDLGALRDNARALRTRGGERVDVIGMVKANAYGHGAVEVSRALLAAGVERLAVAFVAEAQELRAHGIASPLLVMSSAASESALIVEHGITPAVFDLPRTEALAAAARRAGKRVSVHVNVDTGMGRLGVPHASALPLIERLLDVPELLVEGVFTHLSSSDEEDRAYTELQITRFREVLDALAAKGIRLPYTHIQNSGGILNHPELKVSAIRPGISLYGLYPSPVCRGGAPLKPVLSLYSRVAMVKTVPEGTFVSYNRTHRTTAETTLATVSCGYADGLPRLLSSRGRVLIRGRACPIVGRVTMDFIVVDATGVPGVAVDDRVTIIGREGDQEITADEVAEAAQTISYEIATGISGRVRRVYV